MKPGITEAIILAGGLGTRLRSVVPDLPKCMAPVKGIPFLAYVIDYYVEQGIEQFIFSLGYKHEAIENWLNTTYPNLKKKCVIEQEPLGTGGAIQLACRSAITENVLILNGDTFFKIQLKNLVAFHFGNRSHCTLSLKPMFDFNRYGVVELQENHCINNFREKQFYDKGLINGGVYALNIASLMKQALPEKFSFEKDFLEVQYANGTMYGIVEDGYFIDIGIPEDYERAQQEF
jgi:D-glycero-alpha-D-manno-heptose 1-phosphate guanylyltransferase